jgi:hypothetical protein
VTDGNDVKQKYREFLDLMPLVLSLAGLPPSDHGKYYTADQIEARAISIRAAYRVARDVAREVVRS